MILFINNDGTVNALLPAQIMQGSNNTTDLYVVTKGISGFTALNVIYELPTGQIINGGVLSPVKNFAIGDEYVTAYTQKITKSITNFAGKVKVSINMVDAGGNILNTFIAEFVVAKSNTPVLPIVPDEDWYNEVLTAFASLNGIIDAGELYSKGILPYDETFAYEQYVLTYAVINGNIYLFRSLVDNNIGHDVTDTEYWQNVAISGYKGDSVFVRYATSETGENMAISWEEGYDYIGTYVGQTASANPSDYIWAKFVGPQGPQGETGAQGPQGPIGQRGPQGERGIQGLQGVQGEQGPQGVQGLQGPQGVQGQKGEKGDSGNDFTIIGTVSSTASLPDDYTSADIGKAWFVGTQAPRQVYSWGYDENNNLSWINQGYLQGPEGPQGQQGVQGPQGPTGPTGPTGPQGPQGIQGPKGLNPRGVWVSGEDYAIDDIVTYQGSAYLSLTAHSGTTTPDADLTNWLLFVSAGNGRGIVSISKTGTSGLVDTYTITYTDNTTSTFTVTNGADGTEIYVNNVKMTRVNFTSDPQTQIDNKLDKDTTHTYRLYGTGSTAGSQVMWEIDQSGSGANAIPQRKASGSIAVPTPSADEDTANKKYVDDADALKQNKFENDNGVLDGQANDYVLYDLLDGFYKIGTPYTGETKVYIKAYANSLGHVSFDIGDIILVKTGETEKALYCLKGKQIFQMYCSLDGTTGGTSRAEQTDNRTTTLDANSTNVQYPSAKAVYDALLLKEDLITYTSNTNGKSFRFSSGLQICTGYGDNKSNNSTITFAEAFNEKPTIALTQKDISSSWNDNFKAYDRTTTGFKINMGGTSNYHYIAIGTWK